MCYTKEDAFLTLRRVEEELTYSESKFLESVEIDDLVFWANRISKKKEEIEFFQKILNNEFI